MKAKQPDMMYMLEDVEKMKATIRKVCEENASGFRNNLGKLDRAARIKAAVESYLKEGNRLTARRSIRRGG